MNYLLVRHGETPMAGRYCGRLNPALTPRGRSQIKAAARRIGRTPIEACYSSPQRRAIESARILSRSLKVPITRSTLLKEFNFGDWEGLRFNEIVRKWPNLAARWAIDPTTVRIPGGETFPALRRRVRQFVSRSQPSVKGGTVMIVAHGATLAAIALEILNRPDADFPRFMQPLGSVRRIRGQAVDWVTPC